MNAPVFNDKVQFSFSFDADGAHPDLGVEWHCYGECNLKVLLEDGEYQNEFDMVRFFMCADATVDTPNHQYKELDFYNKDFQRNRSLIADIELAITEASMSPTKKDVADFFSFQEKIVRDANAKTTSIMVTTYEVINLKTEAA